MDKFEYYNPVRVICGLGESARVGQEAAKLGKRALLVSYQEHGFFNTLLENIQTQLRSEGVEVETLYAITANPMLSQIRQGVELCRKHKLDLVIAVGGGSVMDAAKAIAAGVLYPHGLWKMFNSRHDVAVAIPPEQSLPTLMVPTLPATSSEMNCIAVATNDDTAEKSYIYHEILYPNVSIIDPRLTCGLPKFQTACGAADAISHVMESYFNGTDDTPLQDRLHEGIILTIMDLVQKILRDPGNESLRMSIQWAATLAWNGWMQCGVSPLTPMHHLGHILSARHNITHGATLTIIMPAWMKHGYRHHLDRYVQFAERIFSIPTAGRDKEAVAWEAIDRFEAFLKSLELPIRLSDVDIKADEIDFMTEEAARTAFTADGVLAGRPALDRSGVKAVYTLAL